MKNHSHENEFNLHVNDGNKTRFEREAKGNPEMDYFKVRKQP